MRRLAHHAVYKVSTTGVNVLSIEMVIDIIAHDSIFKIRFKLSRLPSSVFSLRKHAYVCVCGTVSSMLSGLETRSLGLNTLGTT